MNDTSQWRDGGDRNAAAAADAAFADEKRRARADGEGSCVLCDGEDVSDDGVEFRAGEGVEEGDVGVDLVERYGKVFGAEGCEAAFVVWVRVEGQDVAVFVLRVGGVGGVVGSAGVGCCGVGTGRGRGDWVVGTVVVIVVVIIIDIIIAVVLVKFGDRVGSGVWNSLHDVLDPGWIAEDRAAGGHYCLTGRVDMGMSNKI